MTAVAILAKELPENSEPMLILRGAVDRIREIVQDIEVGARKPDPQVVESSTVSAFQLWESLLSVVSEKRVLNPKARIMLDGELPPSLMGRLFRAELSAVSRVISNLINNALEASDPDSVLPSCAPIRMGSV